MLAGALAAHLFLFSGIARLIISFLCDLPVYILVVSCTTVLLPNVNDVLCSCISL